MKERIISSSVLTTLIYLIGGFDISFQILMVVIVLDYFTGVAKAIYLKKLNSKIGFKGFLRKLMYLIIVILSVMLDKIVGDSGVIRSLVIYFFIANEGISILENVAKMKVPLPRKLIDVLEQLKDNDFKK